MTENERKLALYCLKASSDYHPEVCEECVKYPNCDHTGQDDVIETIIKVLEQDDVLDKIKSYVDHIRNTGMGKKKSLEFIEKFVEGIKAEKVIKMRDATPEERELVDKYIKSISKPIVVDFWDY